jgi:hypothetical protein
MMLTGSGVLHPALRSSEPVAAGSPPAITRSIRWKAPCPRRLGSELLDVPLEDLRVAL